MRPIAEEDNFIQLIRAAMGCSYHISDCIDWNDIWNSAISNHMEGLIFEACRMVQGVPEGLLAKMKACHNQMLAKTVLQGHCIDKLEKVLSEAHIHYGIQKGGILRQDYPKLTMRFMTDIDFYIRAEDRKLIRKAMLEDGFRFRNMESGDEQYCMTDSVGIEFHGRLLYRRVKNGIENYPCWDYVDENANRLTEEGYALNMIGHAVYDLSKGGPGIRYILDLWVYRHRHPQQPDWAKVEEVLKKDGIYEAAKNLMDLSEYLFGNGQRTELLEEMAEYVMQCGLHGSAMREAVSELALTGNRFSALCKQVFRNRAEFENRYPWLKKKPFLLPAAWVIRLGDSFKRHGEDISNWKKQGRTFTPEDIREQGERLSRFGL